MTCEYTVNFAANHMNRNAISKSTIRSLDMAEDMADIKIEISNNISKSAQSSMTTRSKSRQKKEKRNATLPQKQPWYDGSEGHWNMDLMWSSVKEQLGYQRGKETPYILDARHKLWRVDGDWLLLTNVQAKSFKRFDDAEEQGELFKRADEFCGFKSVIDGRDCIVVLSPQLERANMSIVDK